MDIRGDPSHVLGDKMQESMVFVFFLVYQTLVVSSSKMISFGLLQLSQAIADSFTTICEVSSIAAHTH